MIVGATRVVLRIDGARTLKDKRSVVSSLVARTRSRFHLAVAEVEDMDRPQDAVIGLALVGNEWRHVEAGLNAAERFIGGSFPVEIVDVQTERL
jgi:uncharacterized protein YlxP (DUF503 family)